MSPEAARLLEHVHGHLGWLSAAALVHPAILLQGERRLATTAATLSTAFVTLTGSLGACLYPTYRVGLKPILFAEAPTLGLAFERKEHLAIAAVALSWAGLAAHWTESRARGDIRREMRRAARTAYTCAAALTLIAATLGVLVATRRSF
jgi:hypothetical protein